MAPVDKSKPLEGREAKMRDLKMTVGVAIVSAIASVLTAYITFWKGPLEVKQQEVQQLAIKAQGQAENARAAVQDARQQIAQVQATSAGPIEQGQKLCRVLHTKLWRDGLIVPKNWPISLCRDYMLKSGGTKFQLGCVYPDGLNLGTEEGTIPTPNCGWQ